MATFNGFLSIVDSLMSFKIWEDTEGFPTIIARIGFLSSMCYLGMVSLELLLKVLLH